MDLINQIALENDLVVIEDAAQAHGAMIKDQMVDPWGTLVLVYQPHDHSEGGL